MKLYAFSEIDPTRDLWFVRTKQNVYGINKLLASITDTDKMNSLVLQNLKCLPECKISAIDLKNRCYSIGALVLPLFNLCEAEILFLVATVADELKIPVYFSHSFWSLSLKTRYILFDLFKGSDYVNFVDYRLNSSRASELRFELQR